MNCCWVVSQPQSSGLDIHRGCSDDVKRPRLDWGLRAIRPGCIRWICSLECGWPIPLPAIDTGRIERSHWLCRRLLEYAICLKYRREHSRVVHISYDENSRAEKKKDLLWKSNTRFRYVHRVRGLPRCSWSRLRSCRAASLGPGWCILLVLLLAGRKRIHKMPSLPLSSR